MIGLVGRIEPDNTIRAQSQYGEDAQILAHFDEHRGRFLDIGAYDGHTFSNTGQFAECGWSGVCVEPSPSVFPYLVKYHKGRDVICINAAITLCGTWTPFWDANGDALSSVVASHVEKFAPSHPFHKSWIHGVTWKQLLDGFPGPYDFLNIDVEGLNAELALACPLNSIGAELVCLEDDLGAQRNAVLARLQSFGYRAPQSIGGNLLFAK